MSELPPPKILRDGSLLFASLPATVLPDVLARHLARMPGVEIRDGAMWASGSRITYTLGERTFDIAEQFGDYWFLARDPDTPADTLLAMTTHAEELLWENPALARPHDRRAAWGGAIFGMLAFTSASLLSQSPLVRITAFIVGVIAGALAGGVGEANRSR